jgi:hypothetical protein
MSVLWTDNIKGVIGGQHMDKMGVGLGLAFMLIGFILLVGLGIEETYSYDYNGYPGSVEKSYQITETGLGGILLMIVGLIILIIGLATNTKKQASQQYLSTSEGESSQISEDSNESIINTELSPESESKLPIEPMVKDEYIVAFCVKCGKGIPNDANLCPYCGQKVLRG